MFSNQHQIPYYKECCCSPTVVMQFEAGAHLGGHWFVSCRMSDEVMALKKWESNSLNMMGGSRRWKEHHTGQVTAEEKGLTCYILNREKEGRK